MLLKYLTEIQRVLKPAGVFYVSTLNREVEYVKSLGAKRIFFHDDTFNLGIERTIKLAEVLKKG
jgi:ubiquinone/menaquinone biosynthesis C-methylase UbiE